MLVMVVRYDRAHPREVAEGGPALLDPDAEEVP